MSSASAGGTAGGPVIEVDDMIQGLNGDASTGLTADFDLESAWSFECTAHEATPIQPEDLRMVADRQAPQLFRPSGPELPWESEAARGIFGDVAGFSSELPSLFGLWAGILPMVDDDDGIQLEVEQSLDPSNAVFLKAIRHRADSTVQEEQQKAWGAAVSKWARIIMQYPAPTTLGEPLMWDPDYDLPESVSAALGVRASGTASQRANAMMGYVSWHNAHQGLPERTFEESSVWQYLKHLKDSGAAATKGASFMSAMRFAHYVLDFGSLAVVVKSARLKGLSQQMFATKGWLRQAAVLTVKQVLSLHDILRDGKVHMYDRAAAAYFLIAIYGRCRHSDLLHLKGCYHDWNKDDGGFLEFQVSHLKTSRSAQRKAQLIPILIPARGVDGKVWVGEAAEVFRSIGRPLDADISGPLLLPPANEDCTALQSRGLGSDETSDLLRGLLKVDWSPGVGPKISSHSCKSTALSWAAKFGIPREERMTLGRHASATQGTDAIYARDLTVGPTRSLQHMLVEIARGGFTPDAPRSNYFSETTRSTGLADHRPMPTPIKVEGQATGEVEVSDGEGSSSSSSTDSSSTSGRPVRPLRRAPKRPRQVDAAWVIHVKSKIIHMVSPEDDKFLLCGRPLSGNYRPTSIDDEWETECRLCKAAQQR